jgi:hypothetical protein
VVWRGVTRRYTLKQTHTYKKIDVTHTKEIKGTTTRKGKKRREKKNDIERY